MSFCSACGAALAGGGRYCSRCGSAVRGESGTDTVTSVPLVTVKPASSSSSPSEVGGPSGRFAPGTMVAGRYRMVALLGRGGMGEVYRADDLKLDQTVALKFLPAGLEGDRGRLERFLNEVRLARQVSHANVCRVYDVGEVDGRHYLTMEYVDGEDLGSLLRRIGRLEREKALQIARQLCVGLGAAHSRGILHRDLKPTNIMLDGQGQIRITDFGLASLAESVEGVEARAGTPDYMSPEQLAGRSVTTRSDLYALGLVLYELFTGKPAFHASTLLELKRQRESSLPRSPSSVVPDLDPAIERVILRCLDREPASRPPSAIAVAAALPGGDPLAAALAAGETPSPQMLADAPAEGSLSPARGLVCVLLTLVGLAAIVVAADRAWITAYLALERSPAQLERRAGEILQRLGHASQAADSARGLHLDLDYIEHVQATDRSPARWSELGQVRPSPVEFWYRQSPWPLVPVSFEGVVSSTNPPAARSGMIDLRLDLQGRLQSLLVVPPQFDESSEAQASAPAWSALFEAAGLNPAGFEPVEPNWNSPVTTDTQAAWEGIAEGRNEVLRVEAASYRGKAVFFELVAPWTRAKRMTPPEPSAAGRAVTAVLLGLVCVLIVAGVLMTRRNLRLGRTDRGGAFRMACYVFSVILASWLLEAHHVGGVEEVYLLFGALESALFVAAIVGIVYLAFEPYVRRFWPQALISWSRLQAGRFADPLVGRDLLFGTLAGAAMAVLIAVMAFAPRWVGGPALPPELGAAGLPLDWRDTLALFFAIQTASLVSPMAVLFLILLLRVLLRKEWAALGVAVAFGSGLAVLQYADVAVIWPLATLYWAVLILVTVRLGLLAAVVAVFVTNLSWTAPLTLDRSAWYAPYGWTLLAVPVGLALYGFYRSLAGRPLLVDPLSQ